MNYHTDKTGPDSQGNKEAFIQVLKICKEKDLRQMAIAVHTKDQLKADTVVDTFGEKTIKILFKNNYRVIKGLELFIITEKICSAKFKEGPVLANDISVDFLDKLAEDQRITDIIYKPWSNEELKEYLDFYESDLI